MSLARLTELPGEELKAEWARRFGASAPNLSAELLRLGLSYKLQEQKLGGLSRGMRTRLRQVTARTGEGAVPKLLPRKLTPGTRLVRDWHGVGHSVTVLEQGFAYDDKRWRSLTAIARAITGTPWNGPLFFGLTERTKKP